MALSIDGTETAVSANYASDTTSIAVTLSTTNACVVWIAVFNLGFSHKSTSASSISDTAGLIWKQAAGEVESNSHGYLELWYAVTGSALSSDTITATFASETETAAIMAWGVDGVGNTVLDGNGALPIEEAYTSEHDSENVSFSTSGSSTMGLMVAGVNGTEGASISSGWTQISTVNQPDNDNYDTNLTVWYQLFNTAQDDLTVSLEPGGAETMTVLGVAVLAGGVTLTKVQCSMTGF